MNSITIKYDVPEYKKAFPSKEIRSYLNRVLGALSLKNVEFSVSFITEDHIHSLNNEYRNIDRSTDILSFAVEDASDGFGFVLPSEVKRNIGDMLICPEVMKVNAESFKVPEAEELKRLLIHGVLHLSGENHTTNESTEPMLIHQEQILKNLG